MTKLKSIALIITCFQTFSGFADHVSGANITYSCTEITNHYAITVTLYRDCSGIEAPDAVAIDAENTCDLPNLTIILPLISSSEVSQLCESEQQNSTCNDGNLPGMQEYIYCDTVVLPDTCNTWTFTYSVCARNQPLVNLLGSSCLYTETVLYSGTQACNNSVTINGPPIPYICNSIPSTYDLGILESDGDSLVFSFVDALTAGGTPVPYVANFTGDIPIPGISIDPNSGQITVTPTLNGNFVVVVLIEEYNQNGELVGTLMHEFQFVVQNCSNSPPEAPLNVTNFNNFNTNATLTNGNMVTACVNDQFCMDVTFTDPDLGDSLTLTSNINDFLPEATFTQTGVNPATATICWTYQEGYTGSIISVNATDGVCPTIGLATFVIDLDLPPPLRTGRDSVLSFCEPIGEINLFDYLGGYHTTDGIWFNQNYDTIQPIVLADTINSGIYTYVVYANPNVSNCLSSDSAFLSIGNGSVYATWREDSLQNLSCYGADNGVAFVDSIHGENGPFEVIWSGTNGIFDIQTVPSGGSSYKNDLYLGIWSVSVADTIGCFWSHNFDLSQPGLINIELEPENPQCYGMSNGSLTVNHSNTQGSNVVFSIVDSNNNTVNFNGANTANSLVAGWYTVSLTDSANCTIIDSVEIFNPLPPEIELAITDPLCYGEETGSAMVDTILNTQGDYDQVYYIWSANTSSENGLSVTSDSELGAGTYTLEITDGVGCSREIVFTIDQPNPLIGITEVISPTYCRTKGYQSGNGEVTVATAGSDFSGSGNVTYHWENLTNGDESNNTTFIVHDPGWMKVTLKDAHQCLFIDSIYVDSLNPIADFELESDQFEGPGEYEGTEDVTVRLINQSLNCYKSTDQLSETAFKMNWYTNAVPNGGHWFFIKDEYEITDTILKGEQEYQTCLVAKNFNHCQDTLCKIISVRAFPELVTPNVFTPGSFPNQTFFFPAKGIETFNCSVFNRYGIEVFRFTDITDQWDGNYLNNNQPCTDGTYFYTYSGITTKGSTISGEGNINLIRSK